MAKRIILLSIIFISLILTKIFFNNVQTNEFIYTQDEYLILTKEESSNIFYTQNPLDLGSANTSILIVTFFDRVYYFLTYALDISINLSNKILYFVKLVILLLLPYIGYRKVNSIIKASNDEFVTFLISLWYGFNTFTLIYWHGNSFSLTLLICYSLAPLAFAYFHKAIFGPKGLVNYIVFVILAFLMSFALYFFAVFCLLIFVYTIFYTIIKKVKPLQTIKNLALLSFFFLPFSSVLLLIVYDMFFSSAQSVNLTGGETNGNIHGGVLNQLLMWFSWAIYTYWAPRNVYTFHNYFLSVPALIAPFILYWLILFRAMKKKMGIIFYVFILLFLFSIFLAKGPQFPLGEIYTYLIDHTWVFRIFRSPDNKLGFGAVFSLAILLLIVARSYSRRLFSVSLLIVILIQAFPILSGIAITGENTDTSSDRIISLPNEHRELADFLNRHDRKYGYVLTFPSLEVAHYLVGSGKVHIGQDLLPKLIDLPFLYSSDYSGMLVSTRGKLASSLESNNFDELHDFPIRYFIVRRDIKNDSPNPSAIRKLAQEFNIVYRNNLFDVYENPNSINLIQANKVEYTMINPIMYSINIKNLSNKERLVFNQNFNLNWKLYPGVIRSNCLEGCSSRSKAIIFNSIEYTWKGSVFDTTKAIYHEYANSWMISPSVIKQSFDRESYSINTDGTVNVSLVLFFKTQAVFYLGLLISGTYLIILGVYLLHQAVQNKRLN